MIRHIIKLSPQDVKDFVAAASKVNFDVDIAYNRYVVDAKSIIGVLGLDLTKILTVTCHGYDTDFENYLSALALAC